MFKRMTYIRSATFLIIIAMAAIAGCGDPYNDMEGSSTDYVNNDHSYPPTELDSWLYNQFTAPYNIEVKYRWDNSELDPYKNFVPPRVDKVQGVMEVVKRVWIDTYASVAGENFIKQYCPKQFVLVGSANYNFDGSFTLGTAEGGRKVLLYVINDFDTEDHEGVRRLMHIVEHEFGHILHQRTSYPGEFKTITTGYTSNWASYTESEALASGFISPYAMASPDEDFVEMIATMLVDGQDGYERKLFCNSTAASYALIRQKERMVKDYFLKSYNIVFDTLQNRVQRAIREIADVPPVEPRTPVMDVWGFEKEYSTIDFDWQYVTFPQEFYARWANDNALLRQNGYGLDTYFKLKWTDAEYVTMQLFYYTLNGEREYFTANYSLRYYPDETSIGFGFEGGDDNARKLIEEFGAYGILDYFAANRYKIEWARTACPGSDYVGFYPVNQPNAGEAYGVIKE
jgi:substrate import-associated zinc metallohydrolase lipoprotein